MDLETNTRNFPALIVPHREAVPPIQINLYTSKEVRDRLLDQNRHLPDICAADLRLSELSDSELSQTQLLVPVSHPEFPAMQQAYLAEKVTRLKAVIEADVEGALAGETPVAANDMIWTTRFLISGGAFAIGVNGNGRLVRNIFATGEIGEHDLTRLVERTSALISREVMSVLLRLTPRPPFIAGGTDGL